MPSANGVYSLPPGYLAVTGTTIQASQHNPPLEDIASALTARLSRDGSAPMTGAVQFASGTVALPGAVFQADLTSGFYKTTSGIGVAIGGTKVAEFLPGGVDGSRVLGELVPFTGSTLPSALWVLPTGQTLSRTTYPAMWTFVQAEITAGSTLYNNGDGSTTFGVPDMRGRIPAGFDAMGGTAAGRLSAFATLGAVGGEQNHTLTVAELPASIPASAALNLTPQLASTQSVGVSTPGSQSALVPAGGNLSGSVSVSVGGSGGAHNNVQPTLACGYILFVGGMA